MNTFKVKTLTIALIVVLMTTLTFAQQSLYRKAVKEFTLGYVDKALQTINKGLSQYPDYDKFYYLKAKIYYQRDNKKMAIEPLKKYYSLSHNPLALSEIGYIYFELKNYKLAANYFTKYIESGKAQDTPGIQHMIEIALFRDYAYSHPVPYNAQKLPPSINTRWDEYFPDISARGKPYFHTPCTKRRHLFLTEKTKQLVKGRTIQNHQYTGTGRSL